jgi:hypothetical protein
MEYRLDKDVQVEPSDGKLRALGAVLELGVLEPLTVPPLAAMTAAKRPPLLISAMTAARFVTALFLYLSGRGRPGVISSAIGLNGVA